MALSPWVAGRYGNEFEALLDELPLTPAVLADVAAAAIGARMRGVAAWLVGRLARPISTLASREAQRVGAIAAVAGGVAWAGTFLVGRAVDWAMFGLAMTLRGGGDRLAGGAMVGAAMVLLGALFLPFDGATFHQATDASGNVVASGMANARQGWFVMDPIVAIAGVLFGVAWLAVGQGRVRRVGGPSYNQGVRT